MSDAFVFAWRTLKRRFGLFFAALLTIAGAWVALELAVVAAQRFGVVPWAAMHLVFFLFVAGYEVGLLRVSLDLCDGREPRYADTLKHLALGPQFLIGQLLYLLMSVLGLAFLVIPGAYLSARYALFGFCMADGESNVMRAFQQSAILSAGARMSLFLTLLLLFILNILGASLLGLGLFVTAPLSVLTLAAVYRQLRTQALVTLG